MSKLKPKHRGDSDLPEPSSMSMHDAFKPVHAFILRRMKDAQRKNTGLDGIPWLTADFIQNGRWSGRFDKSRVIEAVHDAAERGLYYGSSGGAFNKILSETSRILKEAGGKPASRGRQKPRAWGFDRREFMQASGARAALATQPGVFKAGADILLGGVRVGRFLKQGDFITEEGQGYAELHCKNDPADYGQAVLWELAGLAGQQAKSSLDFKPPSYLTEPGVSYPFCCLAYKEAVKPEEWHDYLKNPKTPLQEVVATAVKELSDTSLDAARKALVSHFEGNTELIDQIKVRALEIMDYMRKSKKKERKSRASREKPRKPGKADELEEIIEEGGIASTVIDGREHLVGEPDAVKKYLKLKKKT